MVIADHVNMIREAHRLLHEGKEPHDCRRFYYTEARLLFEVIKENPEIYPVSLFIRHEGEEN